MKPNQAQRPLNSSMHRDQIGRDGKVSKLAETETIAISPGMKRQSKPSHAYLHGAPLDDEKEPPIKSHEKPIPIHGGMSKASRDKFASNAANSPKLILQDAANLGKPPQKA